MYYETIFYFSDWYYSCIRSSFKFSKESFRMDIKKIMAITDKIWDEKLQREIEREAIKCQHYHQVKFINMNMLQMNK